MNFALTTKARAPRAVLGLGLMATIAACGGYGYDVAVRNGPQAVHPSASALSQRSLVSAPVVAAPAAAVTAPVGATPVVEAPVYGAPVAAAPVVTGGACYDGFGGTNCGVPGDVYTGAQPIVD